MTCRQARGTHRPFRPHERLGILVPHPHPLAQVRLQRLHTAVFTALQCFPGDFGEQALDLVYPRRLCWREVHVHPRVLCQLPLDHRGLLGRVVVRDNVDVQPVGDLLVDGVEELPPSSARCLRWDSAITSPVATFTPANKVVDPCRS